MTQVHVHQNPACPKCHSAYVVKKGKRRNRLQFLQLYRCGECLYRFTGDPSRNKTYPLKHILGTLSAYNLGHSLAETRRLLRRQAHLDLPDGTVRSWLSAYRPLATYARLRASGREMFTPATIIRSFELNHRQIYRFQVHQAKLRLLLESPAHWHLGGLQTYLGSIDRHFPHSLFLTAAQRSSTFPAALHPPIVRKENHATRLAALVLPTSPSNKERHETLQRFMLVNDSVSVAVEVPVYLTPEDLRYYRERGFTFDFDDTVITGHIDFVQVRNGYVHILDYKPEARKEKHAHVQLTVYALALSRRASLPLKDFKCAWFDERDYFEFFPLQGVWPRKALQAA
jgi:hypothetical protein